MNFNRHSHLEGQHAFLGASNYHWLNYDTNKLVERYANTFAQTVGTLLHELACKLILHNVKLTKNDKKMVLFYLLDHNIPRYAIDIEHIFYNLSNYVNDAIGFKMTPEVILYYSDNCFGTADSISFRNNFLRIHDLKTGDTVAKKEQLLIYVALFCLEYKIKPSSIDIEIRIYQFGEYVSYIPSAEDIVPIMDKIISSDKIIEKIKNEEV